MEKKTIHDSDDGDSPLYVGIKYLGLVADQIRLNKEAQRLALREKGDTLFEWLNELRTFYDLVANKTDIHLSTKKIEFFEYVSNNGHLERRRIEIKEKEKYEKWFEQIELMIERNLMIQVTNNDTAIFNTIQYKNDKKIILELSRCTRDLLRDANAKHLIMPEGLQDMKELVKNEWIDREAKKEF